MGIGPDKEKFMGTEYNISLANAFETSTTGAKLQKPTRTNITDMEFHNYVGFKAYFNFVFKDPMLDQRPFIAVWGSN